ncbi:MAG: ATP-binding protein [Acidimicrobiia bacterium]
MATPDLVIDLDHGPTAPHRARLALRHLLGRTADQALGRDAVLVTSELVTNAVKHTNDSCELQAWFCEHPQSIRVEICDASAVLPSVPPPAPPDSLDGRGLALVAALSTQWGAERTPTGKMVWFEIDGDRDVAAPAEASA